MRGVGVVGFLLPPSQTKPLARSAESGIAGAQVHEGSVYPEPTARTPYPSPLPYPTPPHQPSTTATLWENRTLVRRPLLSTARPADSWIACTLGSPVPMVCIARTLGSPVPLDRPYPWIARTLGAPVPLDRQYPWIARTLGSPVPLVRPYPWCARTHVHERPAYSTPGWEPGLTRRPGPVAAFCSRAVCLLEDWGEEWWSCYCAVHIHTYTHPGMQRGRDVLCGFDRRWPGLYGVVFLWTQGPN